MRTVPDRVRAAPDGCGSAPDVSGQTRRNGRNKSLERGEIPCRKRSTARRPSRTSRLQFYDDLSDRANRFRYPEFARTEDT